MDANWKEFFDIECISAIEEISNCNNISSLFPSISHDEPFQDKGNEVEVYEGNEMHLLSTNSFQTRENLLDSVRRIALAQGCATVIRKSKTDKYVIIGCDRGGIYRGTKPKKRKTASRLINCPYAIWGKKKPDGFWKVEIKSLEHNHETSIDMSGHPSCRRFSKEEILRIKEMCMAGIPTRQILSSLRQSNPNLQAISRTVYNAKAKITKESLLGRTMIQALLEELGGGGFTYNIEYDEEGHLTHLFFAHPTSIALTKSYSNVFVMDCTYKTNRYKMPLLDIIRVSSFNKSFYSCFVFLQKEEDEDYVWALTMFNKLLGVDNQPLVIVSDREMALMNAIHFVFPKTTNLVCVWHIEKNVLSHCKSYFKEESDSDAFLSTWTSLINSPCEKSFEEAWHHFEVEHKDHACLLNYIKDTWLPLKKTFVCAWSDEVAHFGNRVTSRAEGAHAVLKKYLQVSTGNLREVKEKICLAIENQFQEIKAQLSSEKLRIPHKFCIPFFDELATRVSVFALDGLYNQYELSKSENLSSQCIGHFSKTMGLPCAHMMREMKVEKLQLNDIHEQWRIDKRTCCFDDARLGNEEDQINGLLTGLKDKYQQMPISQKEDTQRQLSKFLTSSHPLILEPKVQPHKGRPLGSKNKKKTTSTRRDPSTFEIVEKSRKCRVCGGVGHNSRTCQFNTNAIGSSHPPVIASANMVDMIDLNAPF